MCEKEDFLKFYGIESPDGSGVIYGSLDPEVVFDIAHGMKLWEYVETKNHRFAKI